MNGAPGRSCLRKRNNRGNGSRKDDAMLWLNTVCESA